MEISSFGRIFSAAGSGQNDLLKHRVFRRIAGVVGGIAALSLEIRIVSWKFKRVAGNLRKSLNFSASA